MGPWLKMLFPPFLALLLGGWGAPSISREANAVVDWWLDYARVKAEPDDFKGRTLLLGGSIVASYSGREGTTLEILCYSLDRHDRPDEVDEKCGRFLAKTDRVLDPDRFSPSRMVTLIGTVLGRGTALPWGAGEEHPLFRIDRIHLWPLPAEDFPYYYPYSPFYDPFCDPYYGYPYRYRYPGWCW